MRSAPGLLLVFSLICAISDLLFAGIQAKRRDQEKTMVHLATVVSDLALSDLALSTEARYTRHPVASDTVVISMDHPGAIDHFPSTVFWAPIE